MKPPVWVTEQAILLLHDESIAEHGGLPGIRDLGLLQSALARPQNPSAYEQDIDLARLAAAYGTGIARNHPFADDNRRTAFLAVGLSLLLNGSRLVVDKAKAILVMLDLAVGEIDEAAFAAWIRAHLQPR